MTDPEATHPPRQPNTLRNVLKRIWQLAKWHPDVSIPAAALIGLLVGAVLF